MSTNEDCELHDLVKQTLEKSGSISKIRAELRASIFLALQENDYFQNFSHKNSGLQNFVEDYDGIVLLCMIKEFLEFYGLSFTSSVFEPELASYGIECNCEDYSKLRLKLNLSPEYAGKRIPLLTQMLQTIRNNQADTRVETDSNNTHAQKNSVVPSKNNLTNMPGSNVTNNSNKIPETKDESVFTKILSKQSNTDSNSYMFETNRKKETDHSKSSLSLLGNLPPLSPQSFASTNASSSPSESTKQLNKLKAILKDSALSGNEEATTVFSDDEKFYEN